MSGARSPSEPARRSEAGARAGPRGRAGAVHGAVGRAGGARRRPPSPPSSTNIKIGKKSSSFSLIQKIFDNRVLHSNAEIRTHQTCHLLMLTRVTESPIVEAPHERADHDAVARLAFPAVAHAEDASVVGATGPF